MSGVISSHSNIIAFENKDLFKGELPLSKMYTPVTEILSVLASAKASPQLSFSLSLHCLLKEDLTCSLQREEQVYHNF